MSQIYNGSFVLGNTSASTLSAGPGIKLDTSVPGVIGIGTDETVLWSGDVSPVNGTSSGVFSEPMTNFERIRMTWRNNDLQSVKCVECPTSPLNYIGDVNPNGPWWKGIKVSVNSTGFDGITCYEITCGTPTNATSNNYYHVLGFVGINRISGNA